MVSGDAYNYDSFDFALEDGAKERWLVEAPGLGTLAPDFDLVDVGGRSHRLHHFRGRPVVLEFGSFTCPIFCGHIPAMEQVARDHPEATFLVIYTREAHPGELIPPHRREIEKRQAARRLAEAEPIERTVLVDDLAGTVHHAYGTVWDSVFVIDQDGRVVLRRTWNDPMGVRGALDHLQRGEPVALESTNMSPPRSSDGIGHGLLRGGEKALLDFYRSAPPPVKQRLQTSESEAVRTVVASTNRVRT